VPSKKEKGLQPNSFFIKKPGEAKTLAEYKAEEAAGTLKPDRAIEHRYNRGYVRAHTDQFRPKPPKGSGQKNLGHDNYP
jgi:hypothetical protein